MLLVTAGEVERLLPMDRAIAAMEAAMRAVSEGRATLPLRQFMDISGRGGKLGLMPGHVDGTGLFGVKVVSRFPRAPGSPHGSHVGAVLLFDDVEGLPVALVEGGSLTAIRTAAASALATDALARPEAAVVAILGAGEQARRHAGAMRSVRPVRETRIWSRDPDRARALAAEVGGIWFADVREAVSGADIVSTCTSAPEPILEGRWLAPGTHLNLVGSAVPTTAEVDGETVRRARVFVDYRPAALAQAGELRRAIAAGLVGEDHVAGEIGDVLLGRVAGRQTADEITLYKSLGVTAQDLHAARAVLDAARAAGLGQPLDLEGAETADDEPQPAPAGTSPA